MFLTVAKLDNG